MRRWLKVRNTCCASLKTSNPQHSPKKSDSCVCFYPSIGIGVKRTGGHPHKKPDIDVCVPITPALGVGDEANSRITGA